MIMPRLRSAIEVQLAHDALEALLAAKEPVLAHPEERDELGAMLHARAGYCSTAATARSSRSASRPRTTRSKARIRARGGRRAMPIREPG